MFESLFFSAGAIRYRTLTHAGHARLSGYQRIAGARFRFCLSLLDSEGFAFYGARHQSPLNERLILPYVLTPTHSGWPCPVFTIQPHVLLSIFLKP